LYICGSFKLRLNQTMKKAGILTIASLLFLLSFQISETYGQCSMCRAVAESGRNDDSTRAAEGLNNGILYLLAMPYVLGVVAFFIWKANKRQSAG